LLVVIDFYNTRFAGLLITPTNLFNAPIRFIKFTIYVDIPVTIHGAPKEASGVCEPVVDSYHSSPMLRDLKWLYDVLQTVKLTIDHPLEGVKRAINVSLNSLGAVRRKHAFDIARR
jgi:hypothetical protein